MLISLLLGWVLCLCSTASSSSVGDYNVVWTTAGGIGHNVRHQPTWDSTMPIGNGDLVGSVWSNTTTGSVLLMLAKADALATDTLPLKLGLIEITLSPNPFTLSSYYNQTLDLTTSSVIISAGGSSWDTCVIKIVLWVDASTNSLAVQASPCSTSSATVFDVTVTSHSLRPTSGEKYKQPFWCNATYVNPDTVLQDIPSYFPSTTGLVQYHRNLGNDTTFNDTFWQQSIQGLLDTVHNPLIHRTFGYYVYSPHGKFQRMSATTLAASKLSNFNLVINAATAQTDTEQEFLKLLAEVSAALESSTPEWWNYGHVGWWNSFWGRSEIFVSSAASQQDADNTKQITEKYIWNRYTQVIQSRSTYPIKFNGELFVANTDAMGLPGSGGPDWRDWGGSNWYQNTRLPYWNMLGSADFESMVGPLFQYYLRTIPMAEGRTKIYFNHTGIFYTETKTIFGTFSPQDYGCSRTGLKPSSKYPVGVETNPYIHLDYHGGLGLSAMMLDHYLYTQDEGVMTANIEFIRKTLDFFAHHYPQRDSKGKIKIYPTQALETFWCPNPNDLAAECCTNDMPCVAGLHAVIQRSLQLPSSITSASDRVAWTQLQSLLPPLPEDATLLKPAEQYKNKEHNVETPELYSVHPFQLFTVAENHWNNVSLTKAINSFNKDPHAHRNTGWQQGVMNAALLGLTSTAQTYVESRAAQGAADGYRFGGFAKHNQDYEPSSDHFANMNSALQWMLLQVERQSGKGKIVLFPAWPCDWDVQFKLQAGFNTEVQVVYSNKKLVKFTVSPPSRKADIAWINCVKN